jgi:hypothetical protein
MRSVTEVNAKAHEGKGFKQNIQPRLALASMSLQAEGVSKDNNNGTHQRRGQMEEFFY